MKQIGVPPNHVHLPLWAATLHNYVRINRKVLESKYVRFTKEGKSDKTREKENEFNKQKRSILRSGQCRTAPPVGCDATRLRVHQACEILKRK